MAASAPGAAGEVAASCQGRTGGVMARRGGMGRGRRRGVAGAVLRACVRREGRVQMCGDRRNWHSTTAHGPMDAAPSPPRRFHMDSAGYLAASLTPFSHAAGAGKIIPPWSQARNARYPPFVYRENLMDRARTKPSVFRPFLLRSLLEKEAFRARPFYSREDAYHE